jgi:nucleoside-diphosphate-sugar epimerase
MSKLYIIGSSGFIGQHLVQSLRNSRYNPICVDDGDPKAEVLDKLTSVESNSIIIYLASRSQHTHKVESAIGDLQVLSDVFEIAKQSGSTMLVASSSAVSGGNTPYACFAKCAEILAAHYKGKVRTCFLRIYSVYGPGQHDNLIHRAITSILNKSTLIVSSGHFIRDWIHVSDVATYITQVVNQVYNRKPLPPVLHIGTGRGLPVNTALDLIEEMLDKKIQKVMGSPIVNEPVVSVAQKILQGWKPEFNFESGVSWTYLSYEKSRRTEGPGTEVFEQGVAQKASA